MVVTPRQGTLGLVETTAGFLRPNRGPRGSLAGGQANQPLGIARDASVPKRRTQRSPPWAKRRAANERNFWPRDSNPIRPAYSGVFDLITVGQALHWFDFPAFYAEAARVLRPGGVLAAWGYGLMQVSPAVDAAV
ncbi:methyltransferase domain-containing protein [Thioalkalivibrio nitratireducens]|uniref:methyltransferase domain-containing protein n=1 Tax=Thioalkalivibrio nitratireducens TaxID=186931 RepID=UPI001B7FF966|nr:methyltransferase domain-containing protein [Thioalkalivibrio nitratireducens]